MNNLVDQTYENMAVEISPRAYLKALTSQIKSQVTLDWDMLLRKHKYSKHSEDFESSESSEHSSDFVDSDIPDADQ